MRVDVISDPSMWLDRHGDALYAYALVRTRNAATAEDLVQEALLAAFAGRDAFKGESAERTWLTGILKHKVIDHLRRRGREVPLVEERDYPAGVEDACFDERGHWQVDVRDWSRPDRALEQDELRAALRDCIAALPERLGMLFVLREVDGMETDELLAALNISSANNLWVMLSRARLRLRACLEEKAVTPGD
ncbi:MAG: sigma-70 family RNA polymerase sigma factor [Gammaproteobacteria bacterium]|nr:sigma-70 family RNA polymerase sigma factor [Gammaproteobacteria bacterium]